MRTFASVISKPVKPYVGDQQAVAVRCTGTSVTTSRCHAVSWGCSNNTNQCWISPTKCD